MKTKAIAVASLALASVVSAAEDICRVGCGFPCGNVPIPAIPEHYCCTDYFNCWLTVAGYKWECNEEHEFGTYEQENCIVGWTPWS